MASFMSRGGVKGLFLLFLTLFLYISSVYGVDPQHWNATGGIVTYDGDYTIHTFKVNGNFTINQTILNATILVVAGGGYGGQGGGGAGGLLYVTGYNITNNVSVVVGGGGVYSGSETVVGNNGGNSTFSTLIAVGGGTGGYNAISPYFNGTGGGSGGGGALKSATTTYGGLGIVGQGFNGSGNGGYSGDKYPSGAGGGSSQAGTPAGSLSLAGNGGNGTLIDINGTAMYYAGGGGGAIYIAGGSAGVGGLGGGGNGGNAANGSNGVNGTGGGGGGGQVSPGAGGRGGNGIVIIRYLTAGLAGDLVTTLTFNNITPSNLTSLNFVSRKVNITYIYTNGLNGSQGIKIYYKTNFTLSDNALFINGSVVSGFSNKSCSNSSATEWLCQLDDNDILPGSYNIDADTHEDTAHSALSTLSNTADWYKVGLHNLSSINRYGWFEFMVNGSTSALMPVVFCNSSYSTGNPLSDNNCVLIASVVSNGAYNHSHNYSSHKIIPFGIDAVGNINGVKVTSTGYFLFNGGASSPVIYGINVNSDPLLNQNTNNNGNSWQSNIGVTADVHIHQLTNFTTFYYYACDVADICSTLGFDILEQDKIAPTTPNLQDMPNRILKNTSVSINWSSATDPNGEQVSYNLTLLNNVSVAVFSLETSALTYLKNFTESEGTYSLRIRANNTAGLFSGYDYSNYFNICSINFACVSYGSCDPDSVQRCLIVEDLNCNTTFAGVVSTYDLECVFVPEVADLRFTQGTILFGVLVFFWVALAFLALTFRNFAIGSFMWIVGITLGFLSLSISFILTMCFILFSTLLFMGTISKYH